MEYTLKSNDITWGNKIRRVFQKKSPMFFDCEISMQVYPTQYNWWDDHEQKYIKPKKC